MEGWIKTYREIIDHWVWQNDKYLKGWLWFLLRANHTNNKILMGSDLTEVKRGEFITSISKICDATGMTMQSTRTFLTLLEKDKMINKVTTSKLTKISICNYEHYQDGQQTNNKPTTNQQQTRNKQATTDNNDKELKENKYPFVSDKFLQPFTDWIEYKIARKENYKNEKSLLALYNKLLRLSNNNPIAAKLIVEDSMANNYAGLFELKNKFGKTESMPTVEQITVNEHTK
jgi:hypothetical protein